VLWRSCGESGGHRNVSAPTGGQYACGRSPPTYCPASQTIAPNSLQNNQPGEGATKGGLSRFPNSVSAAAKPSATEGTPMRWPTPQAHAPRCLLGLLHRCSSHININSLLGVAISLNLEDREREKRTRTRGGCLSPRLFSVAAGRERIIAYRPCSERSLREGIVVDSTRLTSCERRSRWETLCSAK
jgi:hypothetical protein